MATALFSALSTHEVWGTGRIPLAAWVQSLKEKLDKPRVNTSILVSDPMQIKCGREDERKSDLLSDQILNGAVPAELERIFLRGCNVTSLPPTLQPL